MFVRKVNPDEFQECYDTLCQELYPWQDVVNPPFNSMRCVVEPGKITHIHNHHEGETFFILEGEGKIAVGNETETVGAGDVIYLPPFLNHTLENTSAQNKLSFITVWWEDMKLAAERAKMTTDKTRVVSGKNVLVAPPPPTPNGDLHLGHLSGPYIGADIYTRYLKLRGVNAFYTCGAHDNEGYVLTTAERLGLTGRELADKSSDAIRSTLKKAKIEVDHYWRPDNSPEYLDFIHGFFKKLYSEGKIVKKETPSFYCKSCRKYLFQSFVEGKCPQCGSTSQANSCETCGRSNHYNDLIDPQCKSCGDKPVERPLAKFYFPLKPYEKQLREYYKTVKMDPRLRAICERSLLDGLPERAITQVTNWGVSVPMEGFEDQRFDPWFELAAGQCLFGTQQLSRSLEQTSGWERFWKAEDGNVVQFFGFDNGYFYALLFPALLLAYDSSINLPKVFVNNEFYRLEGDKFSTSRGHAIWGSDFFDQFSADTVRFYLAHTRPETQQTNFSQAEFERTVQRELKDEWNQWLEEISAKLQEEYDGVVPEPGAWTDNHRIFYRELSKFIEEVEFAYEAESFSPQKATRMLCELVRTARRFGAAENYLRGIETKKDELRTSIALELAAIKTLTLLTAPIMPDFATRLWQQLGDGTTLFEGNWKKAPEFVSAGRKLDDFPLINPLPQSVEEAVPIGI